MSIIQNLQIKRGSTFLSGTFWAQLDNISPSVIAGSGGAIPYGSLELISLAPVALQNGDHLYTPSTGSTATYIPRAFGGTIVRAGNATGGTLLYTVNGIVEQFDDHTESMVIRNIQTTP